jgi:selenocysteine lyase/cysteine desulfurase
LISVTEKWLLGPYQLAFLYVAPKHQNGVPIEFGWMNREQASDYDNLVNYRNGYQPGARRFDMGEKGNYVTLPMAVEALDKIIGWTPAAIEDHIAALIDRVADEADRLGLVPTPEPGRSRHMVGLRRDGGLKSDLPQRLADRGVHVTMRGGCLRIAPHVYNDIRDIERLLAALAAEL